MSHIEVHVDYPSWVNDTVDWNHIYTTDEEKMRLAIAISRENVERETGGPFGAAVFEKVSGKLIAVGMNSVVRLNNSTLHGEMVAFMMAQKRIGSFTLGRRACRSTSCSPPASRARCASAQRSGAA